MKQFYVFILFSLFVLTACSGNGGAGSDAPTPVRVTMKIPAATKATAEFRKVSPGVQSIAARVINSAGSPADASEKKDVSPNDEVVFDFEVSPGQVTFIVEAFSEKGSQGILLFRGEKTENIVAGDKVSITIDMQAVGSISPQNPAVIKGGTQQFLIVGNNLPQIEWRLKGTPTGFESFMGRIDPSTGLYTAPATIPYDVAEGRPLGIPLEIQVEAFNLDSNQVHDLTAIRVVSSGVFTFDPRGQITPPGTGSSSTRSISSGQRNIAYYEGNAYAVWEQGGQILFSETVFNASGLMWSNPVVLPSFGDGQARAAIAVGPGGNLYVAYVDCTTCSRFSSIVLVMRKPGETAFVQLPFGDSAGFTEFLSNDPTLAVSSDGRRVFVAWSAVTGDGGNDILLQRVNPIDGIKIDEDPRLIVSTAGDDEQPTIGIAKDGKVYLAWIERNFGASPPPPNALMAAVSLNGDGQFEPAVQVNEVLGNFPTVDRRPTLTPGASGVVHIAWEKNICNVFCNGSIFRVAYDKGVLGADGLRFGNDELLGRFFVGADFQGDYRQFFPTIGWDGANGVYIALREVSFHASDQVDKRAIFLARKSSEADPFSTRSQVDNDIDDPLKIKFKDLPSLTVDETGRVFVIWTDQRGGLRSDYIWFAVTEPFIMP